MMKEIYPHLKTEDIQYTIRRTIKIAIIRELERKRNIKNVPFDNISKSKESDKDANYNIDYKMLEILFVKEKKIKRN